MKKSLTFLLLGIFVFNLIAAQQGGGQNQKDNLTQVMNQMQETIREKLQYRNESFDCDTCNLSMNGSMMKAKLSNGRNAEIKIMPEVASETAITRLGLKMCNESNNCSLELKEVGQGNKTKLAYEIQARKQYKVLGLFKAQAENKVQVNAENGEIISQSKPWWSFIASEED